MAALGLSIGGGLSGGGSGGGGGTGTVTSVAQTFTGGLISVSGSPITTAGTLALTVAGTSGGVPYFSSASTWATSAALAANALVIGGGAGAAPATTTTGTGVVTALGIAVNSSGGIATYPVSGAGLSITVGSTAITGGTNLRILADSAGVVGEYAITGTGTVVAMQTSPNFLTSLTLNTTTILTFPAAATWQHGAADAAAPVAQTIGVQNVVAGTSNTAGAALNIQGSIGTGTGVAGAINIRQALAGTTGSAQNAVSTTWQFSTAGFFLPGTDSTMDIGAQANRVRATYSTSVTASTLSVSNINDVLNTITAFSIAGTGNTTFAVGATAPLFRFAGATSSFPALGRSTTRLTVGLADGTAGGGVNFSTAAVLSMASGTNQRAGNATLVGGTVTVSNTTVTANTLIVLAPKTMGGTVGTLSYTLSAGASFTITSANVLDTSVISYLLIEVP